MKTINEIAEHYVKLSLKIGQHSPFYVDAYYGPQEWRPSDDKEDLATIYLEAKALISSAQALSKEQMGNEQERLAFLKTHLSATLAYINQLQNNYLPFRDECKALYDVIPPEFDEQHFDQVLTQLDKLIPGSGDLNKRLNRYREQFIISKDKLNMVFQKAIEEARERTLKYIAIPSNENFHVELVNDQVWSAYNWYKGQSYSLIELNTDFPIYIERVIDLAAHEGYPGHHVFNALMEKHLVKERGWVEYSIYNLYSPTSLLAEGSANYGIDVAFPWQERIEFERNVLFPLAGIDPEKAELYYQIQALMHKLSYVDNMVAQRYLDGEIDQSQSILLLMKYALSSKEKSQQRLRFIEHNRSYVVTYNYGQDLVKDYLACKVNEPTPQNRQGQLWQVFSDLLARPKTGSMMEKAIEHHKKQND